MTRVLIVDDSRTARLALRRVMESAGSGIEVVAEAATGEEALSRAKRHAPDIITMDVHLGREDGVLVTADLMTQKPAPILIVTGIDHRDPELVFRAVQAGALEVMPKPPGPNTPSFAAYKRRLIRTLTVLARVPVVTRRKPRDEPKPVETTLTAKDIAPEAGLHGILIGASTGGPPLLQNILSALPAPYPIPIVIVQHIVEGFADGLCKWLTDTTAHQVNLCAGYSALKPGQVYVAPDDRHLKLSYPSALNPVAGPLRGFQRPSVDELFESVPASVAQQFIAILLTGMGSDGAVGLRYLRHHGAMTIAQEPSTCAIDSMPQSAIRQGAAAHILTPPEIVSLLRGLSSQPALSM